MKLHEKLILNNEFIRIGNKINLLSFFFCIITFCHSFFLCFTFVSLLMSGLKKIHYEIVYCF